jgi:hypothetical protein
VCESVQAEYFREKKQRAYTWHEKRVPPPPPTHTTSRGPAPPPHPPPPPPPPPGGGGGGGVHPLLRLNCCAPHFTRPPRTHLRSLSLPPASPRLARGAVYLTSRTHSPTYALASPRLLWKGLLGEVLAQPMVHDPPCRRWRTTEGGVVEVVVVRW